MFATLETIRSIHWQPALGGRGVVEGEADVEQAILVILRTPKGSDPHRPDFGSNIHQYLDWPIEQALPHVVREAVDAIRRWEPRCTLIGVVPEIEQAQLLLRVRWQLAESVERETRVSVW
jgi:phage baseplate assembly protein W